MAQTKTLQTQHDRAGHRNAIVFTIGIGVVAGLIRMLVTKDTGGGSIIPLAVLSVITGTVILSEFLITRNSKWSKLLQTIGILLIVFIAFGYLLPLPDPFMILLPVLGVVVYSQYGISVTNYILLALYAFMAGRFFVLNGTQSAADVMNFLLTCVFTLTITYYIINYLRLSQHELAALEDISHQALNDEQQVQSLINNITDGVVAVDHNNRIVIYNAAALDVLDINTAIKGKKISSVLKPMDENSQPVDIESLLEHVDAPVNNRDLRIKYSDDSVANIFLGIAPIYLGYGKSQNNGYTLIMRDITREKSLEEERDEFISVVSHELRTPIAITEGNISNAQFVADKTGDMDVIRKTLKESHNQVLFLADMINDLSTLSRAERGKLEIELATINIAELVAELADNYRPQAETKGLTIHTDVAADVGELQSSKLYVREILQNFITNAIKYTETGSVTIKATANPKGVDFAVIDTGIGISKSDQHKVFDKFFRSEDFRTRANNGTGLGLYVTIKLVRLIHADINLESELNKGSTFSIFIPNLK